MRINTENFLKLSIALFVGFLFFFILPKSASAQCAGWTRCGTLDQYNQCDPDHDYIIGCGNGCSSGGCGGCEISSSCNGGPAPVCECGTRADGSCKPCSGGNQCNADYIRNCVTGTRSDVPTGENFCVGVGACKDGSGNIIVGSAQLLGGCCSEKCVPNPPFEDECFCNGWSVTTYICCPTTAPTNVAFDTATDVLTWTKGSSGTSQKIYYGTHKARVENLCSAGAGTAVCNVITGISKNTTSYSLAGLLNSNKVYYFRVVTWKDDNCHNASTIIAGVSSCIYTPNNTEVNVGENLLITSKLVQNNWNEIDKIRFIKSGSNRDSVSFSPTNNNNSNAYSDSTSPYSVTITGVAPTTDVPVDMEVYLQGQSAVQCNYTSSFSVPGQNTNAWWQVKDGDITIDGDLTSKVPSGNVFLTNGLGGFPGVAIYSGTFNLSSTQSLISSTSWNANTSSSQSRLFNYNYFAGLIPDDVVINNIANLATGGSNYIDGYEWFKINGNLDINSSIDFGDRKVILFVENGDLNINSNLNLNDGIGFFGAFVDGSINVNSSVTGTPALEGMYMADSNFQTGTTGAGDTRLHIRGSVATHGNFLLQRDLTDNSTSAELFEYAPDQILLFPDKLAFKQTRWAEVAP